MSISGYFSDFSFPELLRFVHNSHKTGVLQVKSIDNTKPHQHLYALWFHDGDVIAVQHPSSSFHELLLQFCKQTSEVLKAHAAISIAHREPIGTVLQRLHLIQSEELQAIFTHQVIQPMLYQFTLDNAWFKFSTSYEFPYTEMTGLSLSPIEAALHGLRRLKNWKPLLAKLPESTSSLRHTSKSLPYKLTNEETRVWSCANRQLSLSDIAQRLVLTIEEVRKIAFRLMIAGLVDECPSVKDRREFVPAVHEEREMLETSFLTNLLDFLKQRA